MIAHSIELLDTNIQTHGHLPSFVDTCIASTSNNHDTNDSNETNSNAHCW